MHTQRLICLQLTNSGCKPTAIVSLLRCVVHFVGNVFKSCVTEQYLQYNRQTMFTTGRRIDRIT